MNEITSFDLLIVYSEKIANSANSTKIITTPFSKGSKNESYNLVYGFFLDNCRRNNLKAALTTSADIIGPGKCQSYWLFEKNVWKKVQRLGFSEFIFAKFSPATKNRRIKRNLLFSSKRIKPFSNPHLFDLCFDKQKTYETLKSFSIPTVTIKGNTRQDLLRAQNLLKEKVNKHKNKNDFSEEIVVKNRFGVGGLNIYKFASNQTERIFTLIKRHKSISFILQPFVKFDKGFRFQDSSKPTDIRLIYLGQEIIQTYIRIAKKGSFICNEHAGGSLKYISKNEVPLKIKSISKNIANVLDKEFSLFALDFIVSNNGNVYLLEANTGPGLDWNTSIKENEVEAKNLIRVIIKQIGKRIGLPKNISERKISIVTRDLPVVCGHSRSSNLITTQII